MTQDHDCGVDLARLKRLRGAVKTTLSEVQSDKAIGLPPAYNALRSQVLDAIPAGLAAEAQSIAPEVEVRGRINNNVVQAAQDGARAYAHLSALSGWLDALIGANNSP